MGEDHIDIGQLKHELPRHEKLDLERTVSHMYDLPQSRRRCGLSCSWYPVLGRRSHLGGSLVVVPRYLVAEVV